MISTNYVVVPMGYDSVKEENYFNPNRIYTSRLQRLQCILILTPCIEETRLVYYTRYINKSEIALYGSEILIPFSSRHKYIDTRTKAENKIIAEILNGKEIVLGFKKFDITV